jgi:tetratricopeptide (TPR) repeat protein
LTRSSSSILRAGAAAVVALAAMIPVSGAFLKAQQTAERPQAHILTSAESQVQTGLAMLKAGNPAGAEEAFRMAHELDPKNTEAIMGLVEAFIKQGKTEQAIDLLERELAHAGARADLRMALGNTEVRAGKYVLALTEFQALLDTLDPDSAIAGDVHMRMGETYRRMGNLDAAIAELRLANKLLPDRAGAVSALALALDSSGRWEEAEKEYGAVLRIDPDNAVALNNMAYLMSQHGGDPDIAVHDAERAAQLAPQLPEVNDTLGTVYLANGMTDAAMEIFRQILKKSPANAEHLALRLAEKGQRDAVWADLTAALANHHSKEDDQAIAEIMRKLR